MRVYHYRHCSLPETGFQTLCEHAVVYIKTLSKENRCINQIMSNSTNNRESSQNNVLANDP